MGLKMLLSDISGLVNRGSFRQELNYITSVLDRPAALGPHLHTVVIHIGVLVLSLAPQLALRKVNVLRQPVLEVCIGNTNSNACRIDHSESVAGFSKYGKSRSKSELLLEGNFLFSTSSSFVHMLKGKRKSASAGFLGLLMGGAFLFFLTRFRLLKVRRFGV